MSKTSSKTTWALLESDEEDNSSWGIQTPPKSVTPSLEEQMIRARFWVEDGENWPCCCTDPAHALEDNGRFECPHGSWLLISSWEEAIVPEEHSASECCGNCRRHPLMMGEILKFHLEECRGETWGDIITKEEEALRERETPAQRAARLRAEEVKERQRLARLAESERKMAEERVAMRKQVCQQERAYDHRTGRPLPCQYYLHGLSKEECRNPSCVAEFLKNYPNGVEFPASRGWTAGCSFHREHKCKFFHPDEAEWEIINGSQKPVASTTRSSEPEWRSVGGGNNSRPSSGGGGSSRANGGAGGRHGRGGH